LNTTLRGGKREKFRICESKNKNRRNNALFRRRVKLRFEVGLLCRRRFFLVRLAGGAFALANVAHRLCA
jgi:hypothetical protein